MIWQQLKNALQMLALPITAQIRLDGDDRGRVERIRKMFREGRQCVLMEMGSQISTEQKELLRRIDRLLIAMNPGHTWLDWPEAALRQHAGWQQVRMVARAALVQFNWPLDFPSAYFSEYLPDKNSSPTTETAVYKKPLTFIQPQ